jgi:hypothetical protein
MATAHERIPRPASYDEDGYSWALEQAALLRAGRLEAIDAGNIAEEIESLGKSFANELRSRLRHPGDAPAQVAVPAGAEVEQLGGDDPPGVAGDRAAPPAQSRPRGAAGGALRG